MLDYISKNPKEKSEASLKGSISSTLALFWLQATEWFRKWQEFFLLGISVLVSFLAISLFVIPTLTSALNNRRLEMEAKVRLSKLTTKKTNLDNLSEPVVRAQLSKVSLALPVAKDVPGIYDNLKRLEDLSGVTLDTFSVSPGNVSAVSAESPEVLPVSFATRGTFENIRSFLTNISSLQRIVEISSIRFTSGDVTGSNVSFTGKTYFLGLPSALPPISEPAEMLNDEETKVIEEIGR